MTGIEARPANLPLVFVAGDDFGFDLTVLEAGIAYVSTGATVTTSITTSITTLAGTVQATNFATSWASNVLAVGLTDTETTTLGPGTYRYSLTVTKSGVTRAWLGGVVIVLDRSLSAGVSSADATLAITADDVALAITVGTAGPTGVGVPAGGTTGQVLAKIDGTDHNTQWIDI